MPDEEALKDKLEEILYPDDRAKAFKITLVFLPKTGPEGEKAVALARRGPGYRTEGGGEFTRHQATYTPDEVDELFELFSLVHSWPETEVLVNHKRLPYGHQLWLPLMWFYRIR
ncbi:MAG: hypothetical protein FJY83_02355 [Candidatus Aminicenantes bacterium]|nr:hypothetical protein [Candidatus Aminicenantes bacterium]